MTAIQPASANGLWKDHMQPFDGGVWDTTAPAAWTASTTRTVRVRAPRSGILTIVAICVGTQNGNVEVGIADCGETTPAVRTKLWSTGSIPCPAAGPVIAGTANLAVVGGRQYDFFLGTDSGSATFARGTFGASGMAQLPTGFLPNGGLALPKPCSVIAAYPFGASQAEANLGAVSLAPWILGLVV